MNIIGLIGAIGLSVISGAFQLQPKKNYQDFGNESYSVTKSGENSSWDYIQGNFQNLDDTWNYNMPSLDINTDGQAVTISCATLFKLDNVIYSNGYKSDITNSSINLDLFTWLSNQNDYYCGLLDVFVVYAHNNNYYYQYMLRYPFYSEKVFGSDFEFSCSTLYSRMKVINFDNSFLRSSTNAYTNLNSYLNYSYYFANDLMFGKQYIFADSNMNNSFYVGGFKFYFTSNMYLARASTLNTIDDVYTDVCQYGNLSNFYSSALLESSCSFTIDFTRISYEENVIYNDGYNTGYNNGYNNGNTDGYNNGYDTGYTEGNTTGYNTGYDNGYDIGKADGINASNQYTFLNLFGAVADTPVLMIRSLFDFDFFGVNLLSVVLSLFTALIVFYLWRKIV